MPMGANKYDLVTPYFAGVTLATHCFLCPIPSASFNPYIPERFGARGSERPPPPGPTHLTLVLCSTRETLLVVLPAKEA